MVKNVSSKRIIKFALSVLAVIVVFMAFGMSANAETYNKIKYDVPRISQRPYTGDCAIASMATVEAYCYGLPSGDYNSEAYQAVYSTNGYSISAMWSKLGYEPVEYFDKQIAYNQLKTGYPVIVHRGSSHYSVIYGYDGSASSLELSGFLVCDVDDSYNSTTAYKRLDSWAGGYGLDRMIIRKGGLALTSKSLTITGNHPSATHEKGAKFTPDGMIVSKNTVTDVSVTVKSSTGNALQTFTAKPNAKSYRYASLKGIDISKLSVGNYVYSVSAKDSSGAKKNADFSFKVVSGSYVPPEEDKPVIKKVSYKAVVSADPSLNLRMGASIDSTYITSIPYGEVIEITAECNDWAMTTYKGHSGWVSMKYLDKYVEPDIKPIIEPTDPITMNIKYGRVTAATSIKGTKSYLGSNVCSVAKNAIVRIVSADGSWVKVSFNGKEGYLSSTLCVVGLFDVDFNSSINSADALCTLEHAIGKKKLEGEALKVADANGDGQINSLDALAVLQVATGEKTY